MDASGIGRSHRFHVSTGDLLIPTRNLRDIGVPMRRASCRSCRRANTIRSCVCHEISRALDSIWVSELCQGSLYVLYKHHFEHLFYKFRHTNGNFRLKSFPVGGPTGGLA